MKSKEGEERLKCSQRLGGGERGGDGDVWRRAAGVDWLLVTRRGRTCT